LTAIVKKLNNVRFILTKDMVQEVKKYAKNKGILRPTAYQEILLLGLANLEANHQELK